MTAYADKEYCKAQLAAAIAARRRLTVAATKVFGAKKAKAILRRVARQWAASHGQDAPTPSAK